MKPRFRSAFAGFSGFSVSTHAQARKPSASISRLPARKIVKTNAPRIEATEPATHSEAA